ncbi:hypothetical protein MHYP_G00291880 [Metynnis hypsauchen]
MPFQTQAIFHLTNQCLKSAKLHGWAAEVAQDGVPPDGSKSSGSYNELQPQLLSAPVLTHFISTAGGEEEQACNTSTPTRSILITQRNSREADRLERKSQSVPGHTLHTVRLHVIDV